MAFYRWTASVNGLTYITLTKCCRCKPNTINAHCLTGGSGRELIRCLRAETEFDRYCNTPLVAPRLPRFSQPRLSHRMTDVCTVLVRMGVTAYLWIWKNWYGWLPWIDRFARLWTFGTGHMFISVPSRKVNFAPLVEEYHRSLERNSLRGNNPGRVWNNGN